MTSYYYSGPTLNHRETVDCRLASTNVWSIVGSLTHLFNYTASGSRVISVRFDVRELPAIFMDSFPLLLYVNK